MSRAASSSGSRGCLPKDPLAEKYERYQYFSDNSIKDRLATQMAASRPHGSKGGAKSLGPGVADSGRAGGSSWDKYYFFSVPADNSVITGTCRHGRGRPAADGPQTFLVESFSPEVMAKEKKRREKQGTAGERSAYTELFSQMPRAGTSRNLGPLEPVERVPRPTSGKPKGPDSTALTRSTSSPAERNTSFTACAPKGHNAVTEAMATMGEREIPRTGPFWPPPDKRMPDYVRSRQDLFGGEHRCCSDLFAKDRKAPRSCYYTVGVGM